MRRVLIVTASVLVAAVAVFAVVTWRGHHMIVLEGVLQRGFERSDFYDRGDCSRRPWWLDSSKADSSLNQQWIALGRPAAIRIRFIGNVSSMGMYGHLGHYWREVSPVHILQMSGSEGCVR